MRLTTLARKIEKTPKQLISYLEEHNIEINNGLHSKLDKETVALVLEEFASEKELIEEVVFQEEIIEEKIASVDDADEVTPEEDEKTDKEPIVVEKDEAVEIEIENSIQEEEIEPESPKTGTIDDLEKEDPEDIDLIKVKKVTLEGIKVVGKIDLPEKPKKEASVDESEGKDEILNEEKPKLKKEKRSFDRGRKKNRHGKNRAPLSYEERVKEEEREKLKKRRRRENAEKRRKKKFYDENIKSKQTLNAPKKKIKKQSNAEPHAQKEVVLHKNPLKRLWAWLNGKYDQY